MKSLLLLFVSFSFIYSLPVFYECHLEKIDGSTLWKNVGDIHQKIDMNERSERVGDRIHVAQKDNHWFDDLHDADVIHSSISCRYDFTPFWNNRFFNSFMYHPKGMRKSHAGSERFFSRYNHTTFQKNIFFNDFIIDGSIYNQNDCHGFPTGSSSDGKPQRVPEPGIAVLLVTCLLVITTLMIIRRSKLSNRLSF
jgi:hypothetical protein